MQAQKIHNKIGAKADEGRNLYWIGVIYHAQGKIDEALIKFQQAKVILVETQDKIFLADDLYNIAIIYSQMGKIDEAIDLLDESVELARLANSPLLQTYSDALKELRRQRQVN